MELFSKSSMSVIEETLFKNFTNRCSVDLQRSGNRMRSIQEVIINNNLWLHLKSAHVIGRQPSGNFAPKLDDKPTGFTKDVDIAALLYDIEKASTRWPPTLLSFEYLLEAPTPCSVAEQRPMNGQGFTNWHYAAINVAVSSDEKLNEICVDAGTTALLVSGNFLEERCLNPHEVVQRASAEAKLRSFGDKLLSSSNYAKLHVQILGYTNNGDTAIANLNVEMRIIPFLKADIPFHHLSQAAHI